MKKCHVCSNQYDKAFEVTMDGKNYTFDCFECAVHALAPQCNHCKCKIIGHGLEENNQIFCCAHCAKQEGSTSLKDRA